MHQFYDLVTSEYYKWRQKYFKYTRFNQIIFIILRTVAQM